MPSFLTDLVVRNAKPRTAAYKLGDGAPSKCMSEGTMGAALASIGYGPAEHTPHGWRSVFSTLANNARKFETDVIEAQLAHVKGDKVSAAYNRNDYPEERIALMNWWADELDSMRKRARQNARFAIES